MKSKRAREAAEVDDKPVNNVEAEAAPAKKRKRSDDGAAATADVKKAKKDKKDKKHQKESRKERKEKRKDLQNLPEQDEDEEEQDAPMADAEPAAVKDEAEAEEVKASKKEKKSKKDKKKESKEKKAKKDQPEEAAATANGDAPTAEAETEGDKKKDKKDKKREKKEQKAAAKAANGDAGKTSNGDGADGEDKDENEAGDKKDRHIVFVGNLPFTATPESITAHFASLSPISVRCLSDPKDAQSRPCRGIAFVEFGKVWHQRTCLDKFHHSMFEDGKSPARRINVELTAGGGGKTQKRQTKIREKNDKLNENRTKRIEREKQTKTENTAQEQLLEDSIHPSRRARVPGNF